MYAPRKQETPLAGGRLDALAFCLLKSLGVRHEMVCAFSAVEANNPQEKRVACRAQLSEVFLAEVLRYAPEQQGFHHLGL